MLSNLSKQSWLKHIDTRAFNGSGQIRQLGWRDLQVTRTWFPRTEPNRKRLSELMQRSPMLVTALVPKVGYDKAAAIAKAAHKKGTTLREEAIASGHVTAEEFDGIVRPETMLAPVTPSAQYRVRSQSEFAGQHGESNFFGARLHLYCAKLRLT